jgi:glycyl-tRNA synthetase
LKKQDKYEIISELAKRRGFFWSSYEIYGGASGFITYGHLGTLLKRKIENKFRKFFVHKLGLFEIESSMITPSKVFEASGHVNHFKEPMVECSKCNRKFRADHILEEYAGMSDTETEKLSLEEIKKEIEKHEIHCPDCGGKFNEPKYFFTMFTTTIGPYSDSVGYGRPEAAQGIFVEFRRLYEFARGKLPFGVLQIGHAARNEISPRQGPLRLREFTIIDVEFFFDPEEPNCVFFKEIENEKLFILPAKLKLEGIDDAVDMTAKEILEKGYVKIDWHVFFMVMAKKFLESLGIPESRQRFVEKLPWERAHYSKQSFDQQIYLERWGWTEVSGHAYRTDYDLNQHMKHSGVEMQVFQKYEKPIVKEKVIIKPIHANIGPNFKEHVSKVIELLSKVNAEELEVSLKTKGFFNLNGFKILPEHVEIIHEQIEEHGRKFVPHVIEPSFGSDRLTYVALEYAYQVKEDRVVLGFPRDIAPFHAGIFPLVTKDGLREKALEVYNALIQEGFDVEYDEAGSIGRRYARADEAGTALGITIDYQTLKDDTVTVRDRDSWKQLRTPIQNLPELLHKYFAYKINFEDLGVPLKETE